MKHTLLILAFILSAVLVKAQDPAATKTAFSAGFELALPSGGVFSIGTGASAKLEIPLVQPLCLSLTAGITPMFYKSNLFGNSHTPGAAVFAPIKAGLKYYFAKSVYAEGEAGTAIETNYGKGSVFAFSIGPGFIAPINDKTGVDIGFRYEDWAGQVRQTAIRIAYRF
ncbi:MAG: hypothetical protein JST32_10825 [Bacteroidetes bacterium]|nr:hypothetical protein [Bacteroidota bacterium]